MQKKKVTRLLQRLKGKRKPGEAIAISKTEEEVLKELRRIRNDLQPGNGHSMPRLGPMKETMDQIGDKAKARGLNAEVLDAILEED